MNESRPLIRHHSCVARLRCLLNASESDGRAPRGSAKLSARAPGTRRPGGWAAVPRGGGGGRARPAAAGVRGVGAGVACRRSGDGLSTRSPLGLGGLGSVASSAPGRTRPGRGLLCALVLAAVADLHQRRPLGLHPRERSGSPGLEACVQVARATLNDAPGPDSPDLE